MQEGNVIEVRNITKSFKIYYDKGKTLKDRLSLVGKNEYQKREVLKGISFSVKNGEAIGLIGKNGCGKSTTLKMLTRIIYPDSGSIEINGKVSSLLELGAGFHPDMNGRENIYLNASIFGLSKKEIDKKVDEIIEFSELGEFIENPVRTYSSGMYMRLAFSVAINVDAEILLIDEILGVGDVSFQKKCFEKLKEIKMLGTTIVIVSHSLEQIEQICERSIWISDGLIREEGKPSQVNAHYYRAMEEERLLRVEKQLNNNSRQEQLSSDEDVGDLPTEEVNLPGFCDKLAERTGNQKIEITDFCLWNVSSEDKSVFTTNDILRVRCKINSNVGKTKVSMSVSVWRDDGLLCYGVNTFQENEKLFQIEDTLGIELEFERVSLLNGKYWIDVGIYSKENEEYDVIKHVKQFYIYDSAEKKEQGVYQMAHKWGLF